MKASGSPDLFFKFKRMRKNYEEAYPFELYSVLTKSIFWSFHSMKPKRKRIPEIVYYIEAHSTNLATKVEVFNHFFCTVYCAPTFEKTFSIDPLIH